MATLLLIQQVQNYYEFQPEAFIKQPWNAYSSLFFFVPVIYWLWMLRGNYRRYTVLTAILPLLFLNGVGSTLFHAFNGGLVFTLLDVLPPFVMTLFLAAYFWKVAINSWVYAILITLGFLALNISLTYIFQTYGQPEHGVNIYYLIAGLMILTPIYWNLSKDNWHGWHLVAIMLGFVSMALFFRSIDYPTPNPFPEALPQGTHFLWHITSACAVFPLGFYLIRLRAYSRLARVKKRGGFLTRFSNKSLAG